LTHTPLIPAQAGIQLDICLDTRLRGDERISEVARWLLGSILLVFLTACGQGESAAQEQPKRAEDIQSVDELLEQVREQAYTEAQRDVERREMAIKKMRLENELIECKGVYKQGGMILCENLAPNSLVSVLGVSAPADKNGRILIGFDRDAKLEQSLQIQNTVGLVNTISLKLEPREYTISRIDGLPPSQVSTFSDAQLKRIRSSSARKKIGFSSRQQTMWFKDGFSYPLKDFIKTSPFGAQRILNGEAKRPHYGVDIAAPAGTPIYAPADGVISLADDDLYFEGAMVLLDHGQGLISMYLHMSEIDVTPGQEVKRGEKIGAVGSTGRSTGPHLCWRLKWRNRNLDPELLTEWPAND